MDSFSLYFFLFVSLPLHTSIRALTILQSLPLDGFLQWPALCEILHNIRKRHVCFWSEHADNLLPERCVSRRLIDRCLPFASGLFENVVVLVCLSVVRAMPTGWVRGIPPFHAF